VRSSLSDLVLPPGSFIEYGGQYENLAHAARRLLIIVPLTLLFVLLLLYWAFGRVRPAVLVFVNIPAAVTGGAFALAARGLDLSISAAVGFLALFGVATLNGVVLMTAILNRQNVGQTPFNAVFDAASDRLRPVLTTASVAALGFLPMAVATGTGAEVQRPLASVVIGGLVTSTLITLFVLPAFTLKFGGLSSEGCRQED
jgi:heavy metal efflux system protein